MNIKLQLLILTLFSPIFFVFANENVSHSNTVVQSISHFAPGTKMGAPLNFMFPKLLVKFFPSQDCSGSISYFSINGDESTEIGISVAKKNGLQFNEDLELKDLGEQFAIFKPKSSCSGEIYYVSTDSNDDVKSIKDVHIGTTGLLWKGIYAPKSKKLSLEEKKEMCNNLVPKNAWNLFDIKAHKEFRTSPEFKERNLKQKAFRDLMNPLDKMIPEQILKNKPSDKQVIYCLGSVK